MTYKATADEAAKAASLTLPSDCLDIPYTDLYSLVISIVINEWQTDRNKITENKVR